MSSSTTTLLVGDTASMSITSIAAKTTATATTTATTTTTTTTTATSGCPSCGFELRLDSDHAQRRISELEAQVKFLNKRAVETAEKLADYEDEIRFLRSKITNQSPSTPTLVSSSQTDNNNNNNSNNNSNNNNTLLTSPPQHQQVPTPPSQSRLGTLASLLPYARRNAPTPPPLNRSPSPTNRPPISPSASYNSDNYSNNQSQSQFRPQDQAQAQAQAQPQPQPQPQPEPDTVLQSALSREQALRKQAESRLNQTNSELEELTAQLFCQANEMVAQERRARAKLEERVDVLERRDAEKRDRLDRLERAVERVERIRGMVG
ncbi:hypothetical protein PAAG_06625 [Paracoccidioides lutzii Pb01]|uniref:GDP/GTP exchange factor Sec2 N-terminal domain-containing protein n=1 Tax=Paracoccidioides lutzii (strain ATCC MYA-826 / Pb01) TaxID=502779 RepID=C1H784_PARBA|nr:hypothetical protein PAAG_06625 [Paracoccidioides lutzii Pb01]EEH35578.2 hypothetical protein PAAG_06625 [Paracoccidioides lutzii Pb01]